MSSSETAMPRIFCFIPARAGSKGVPDKNIQKIGGKTLTRLAVEGTKFEGIKDLFSGPTAIAYSTSPVATAKLLVEAAI